MVQPGPDPGRHDRLTYYTRLDFVEAQEAFPGVRECADGRTLAMHGGIGVVGSDVGWSAA
jgi:hypothetical protein